MKRLRRFLCLILIVNICISAITDNMCLAAKLPTLTASVTEKNIMAILKKYDKDGAYILNYAKKNYENFLVWWSPGEKICDSLETAVHEQCHGFTFSAASNPMNGEAIYIGNKKKIQVKYTTVYESKKMAKTIPKKLRMQRYDTYVAKPMENLSSNVDGAYGLLNEFSAYCWGMNNVVSMFDYYKSFGYTPEIWNNYLNIAGGSTRLAHMEFKYYILQYLLYAKKHYKNVYKGITKNKKFAKAYIKTDKRFYELDEKYQKNLKNLEVKLKQNGYSAEYTGDKFWITNGEQWGDDSSMSGMGLYLNEYETLEKVLKKTNYKKVQKVLKRAAK